MRNGFAAAPAPPGAPPGLPQPRRALVSWPSGTGFVIHASIWRIVTKYVFGLAAAYSAAWKQQRIWLGGAAGGMPPGCKAPAGAATRKQPAALVQAARVATTLEASNAALVNDPPAGWRHRAKRRDDLPAWPATRGATRAPHWCPTYEALHVAQIVRKVGRVHKDWEGGAVAGVRGIKVALQDVEGALAGAPTGGRRARGAEVSASSIRGCHAQGYTHRTPDARAWAPYSTACCSGQGWGNLSMHACRLP